MKRQTVWIMGLVSAAALLLALAWAAWPWDVPGPDRVALLPGEASSPSEADRPRRMGEASGQGPAGEAGAAAAPERPVQPVPPEALAGDTAGAWHAAFPGGIRVEATVILAAKDGARAHALADAIERCVNDSIWASKRQAPQRVDPRREAFCQTLGAGWDKMYWDLRTLAFEQKVPRAAAMMFSDLAGWDVYVTQAQKEQAWKQRARDALSGDDPDSITSVVLNTYQSPTGLTERELLILWAVTEEMGQYKYDEFGVKIMNRLWQNPSNRSTFPQPIRLSELSKTQRLTDEEKARVRAIVAKIDQQRILPLDRRP